MRDDGLLRDDVLAELEFEPRVDARHIGVTAEKGVVTLSGHVATLTEKRAAEAAVRRVRGVRAIAEEIEVRLPSFRKGHDDEIAKRAADILSWREPNLTSRIRITVSHGVVTLEGDVEWYYQRADVEHDIWHLSGVVGVINKLVVRAAAQPVEVMDKIKAALERSADLEAKNITVSANGDKIVLGGRVHTWHERDLAERAAWAAPHVVAVQNMIAVEP